MQASKTISLVKWQCCVIETDNNGCFCEIKVFLNSSHYNELTAI